MCEQKFFRCKHCGNMVGQLFDAGVPLVCCGEPMEELIANTVDASVEKHVPVVTVEGDLVKVVIGAVEHPMTEEHHITWIYLLTERGGQRKCLRVGEKPEISFAMTEDKPLAAYAYCNLHGLWKADV